MIDKQSEFKKNLQKRDALLLQRFEKLIGEGYSKMQAYKVLREEFGMYSNAGVYKAITRAKDEKGE